MDGWYTYRLDKLLTLLNLKRFSIITEAGIALGDPKGWKDSGLNQEQYVPECVDYVKGWKGRFTPVLSVQFFTSGGGSKWNRFEFTAGMLSFVAEQINEEPSVADLLEAPAPVQSFVNMIPQMDGARLSILNLSRRWYEASQIFGEYDAHPEKCWDLNTEEGGNSDLGEKVGAPFTGVVLDTQTMNGWGNTVRVFGVEANGTFWVWLGAHYDKVYVRPGQIVTKGEYIANIGNTGTTWSHEHEQFCKNVIPPAGAHPKNTSYPFVKPYSFYLEHGVSKELLDQITLYNGA
jgi:murein DD-endopeptidase MepM/ murein hydrolase activator NlpD